MSEKTEKKTPRSETISVRLDPKLRYLAELAARRLRRSLSSFVEWSIEDSLKRIVLEEREFDNNVTIRDISEELWDVDDADRFVKLAFRHPELLNHSEQVLWKMIREFGHIWKGRYVADGLEEVWTWAVKPEGLVYERLRKFWDLLNRVARGETPRSEVTWVSVRTKPNLPGKPTPATDEEVPF